MKALTIENEWFVAMILQMYTAQKLQKNIKFQLQTEYSEFQNDYPMYNMLLSLDTYFKKQSYFYSFSTKIFEHNEISYESNLINNLQILSLNKSQDSMTISHNLIEDEYCFKTVFDSLADLKFLQYNIKYLVINQLS